MDLLTTMASASIRALALAAFAQLALWILRTRSAAVKHAVWTAVTLGMFVQLALMPMLPDLPLRILPARPASDAVGIVVPMTNGTPSVNLPPRPISTTTLVTALVYFVLFLFFLMKIAAGFWFTRALVRRSRLLEIGAFESQDLAAPMTVGWLRPKILLPLDWREWDTAKLNAVLAHERAHINRADWLIAVIARLNRCLFWFHPLSWWLERRLNVLAEEACDDSALRTVGDRGLYAQALLEVAQTIQLNRGRFLPSAPAMAKQANVRHRLDRILDDSRAIPRALTRRFVAALMLCAIPLITFASAVKLMAAKPRAATMPSRWAFLQAQSPVVSPYQRWLTEDVVYIISDEERDAFNRLTTDEERTYFIEQFWQRRPNTKEEHYRRIAYANERYRSSTTSGWKTARGRIYITIGPPDEIESHPSGGSHEPLHRALGIVSRQNDEDESPFEVWRYRNGNVTLGFVDPNRVGDYAIVQSGDENGPRIIQPVIILGTAPVEYPKEALAARIEGNVGLSIVVGVDGAVQSIGVFQPLHPALDQRAIESSRTWRFRPGSKDGQPIPVAIRVYVRFKPE